MSSIREEQKNEAMVRLERLNLHENVIRDFEEENKLNSSEKGMLFWLKDDEKELVNKFEEETGNLVYHVIKGKYNVGELLDLLYISKYKEEWELDNDNLDFINGTAFPMSYCINRSGQQCSEYGSIGVQCVFGGLVRIY